MTMRVVVNTAAFEDLRTSPAVRAHLLERGKRIRDACGAGYEVESEDTETRARVTIWPETSAAVRDNAANNTLLRNLDKGR